METINQGYEFLPVYADCYLAEELTPDKDGVCPACGSEALSFKGKRYCPKCYPANRKEYGRCYTDEEMNLFLTLLMDEVLEK